MNRFYLVIDENDYRILHYHILRHLVSLSVATDQNLTAGCLNQLSELESILTNIATQVQDQRENLKMVDMLFPSQQPSTLLQAIWKVEDELRLQDQRENLKAVETLAAWRDALNGEEDDPT